MAEPTPQQLEIIGTARVARLATADPLGVPHLVPICFAHDGESFLSVLDRKPKRTSLKGLKRVRNILANPNVALLLDHYEEEWGRLWYVLITGTAQLIQDGEDHRRAIALLREKYPQYRDMDIEEAPVIVITPAKYISWGHVPSPPQLPRPV